MFKLKSQTWYYIYTDGKEYFISKDVPIRNDKADWHHPEVDYKCYLKPLWIDDPVSSENIQEFYDFKEEKYVKIVIDRLRQEILEFNNEQTTR